MSMLKPVCSCPFVIWKNVLAYTECSTSFGETAGMRSVPQPDALQLDWRVGQDPHAPPNGRVSARNNRGVALQVQPHIPCDRRCRFSHVPYTSTERPSGRCHLALAQSPLKK